MNNTGVLQEKRNEDLYLGVSRYNYKYDENKRFSSVKDIIEALNKGLKSGLTRKEVEALVKDVFTFICDYHKGEFYGIELPPVAMARFADKSKLGAFSPDIPKNEVIDSNYMLTISDEAIEKITDKIWNEEIVTKSVAKIEQGATDESVSFKEREAARRSARANNALASLIMTICHEFEHFQQYALKKYYNSLSPEEQKQLDDVTKQQVDGVVHKIDSAFGESIIDHKEHKRIDENTGKRITYQDVANSFLMEVVPYFSGLRSLNDIVREDNSIGVQDLAKTISYAYYLNNFNEKDARFAGAQISTLLYDKILQSEDSSLETQAWAEQSRKWAESERDETSGKHGRLKNFMSASIMEKAFQNEQEFITFAKHADKYKNNNYEFALEFFLRGRTLEEQVHIYKNAMYHGLVNLGDAAWEKITASASEEALNEIKRDIAEHLRVGSILKTDVVAMQGEPEKLISDSYTLKYHNIFSMEELVTIVGALFDDNKITYAKNLLQNISSHDLTDELFEKVNKRVLHVLEKPLEEPTVNIEAYIEVSEKFGPRMNDVTLQLQDLLARLQTDPEMAKNENVEKREEKFLRTYSKREYAELLYKKGDIEKSQEYFLLVLNEGKKEAIVSEKEIERVQQEKMEYMAQEEERRKAIEQKKEKREKLKTAFSKHIESLVYKDEDGVEHNKSSQLIEHSNSALLPTNDPNAIKSITAGGEQIYFFELAGNVYWSFEKELLTKEKEEVLDNNIN